MYYVEQELIEVRADSLRPLDEIIYKGQAWLVVGIMHHPATGMCAYTIKRGACTTGVSYYCGTLVQKVGQVTDVVI
jgi:hypothetical protein